MIIMVDIIEEVSDNLEEPVSDPAEMYDNFEEPVSDPAEVSDNDVLYIVSDNGVTKEEFKILIDEVKGLREDVKNKQYNIVFGGVSADNVSYNQTVSVSDNIIYKRIKDYNTSESMGLIGLVLAFSASIIYLIHKTIFKIRR